MKIMAMVVGAAILCGCSKGLEDKPLLMPIADSCSFKMLLEITSTESNVESNLVMGNRHLIVENRDNQDHEVAIPTQEAQAVTLDSICTFEVQAQPVKRIPAGKQVTFIIPFAMVGNPMDVSGQFVVLVDGISHIVGVHPEN